MILAIGTGLSLIVLSARTVKISQHTVAGCFILTWVGLTKVRVPMAWHLHTNIRMRGYKRQKNEEYREQTR